MSPSCALCPPMPGHRRPASLFSPNPCSHRASSFRRRSSARIFYRLSYATMSPLSARWPSRSRARSAATGATGGNNYKGVWGEPCEEEKEKEARGAVVELLQECGASTEEAAEIVSKCPKYLETVLMNVRELDEYSLWGSWKEEKEELENSERGGGGEDSCGLSFRRKVYLMAKKKGDNGVLPYLESVGLRYSSSVHIAGYVSSMSLRQLIVKVKFLKEMLFSGERNDLFLGRNARRMMTQLSIPVDEDVQQTLSFFEKMEARRGGLDMLDVDDVSFWCLVESFPRLLSCSLENKLQPLIQLLEEVGVPRERIKNILLLFPSLIFCDIQKDLKPRIDKMHMVSGEDKNSAKMLMKYPWILSSGILENYEQIVSFFEMEKVARESIDHAVKSWPHILGCSTNKMRLMVEQFGHLGISSKMFGKVIAASPQLLLRKPDDFLKVVSFMKKVGFDDENIGRIMCRCPEIFASSVEKTLEKKLDFLMDLGISHKHLSRVIKKYPELLVSDVYSTLVPRMKYLMKAGFSRREVGSMVYRFSPLLGYSVDVVLKPKLDFLIETMQKPLKEVVDYPRYFSYSLEKRIKPRFWVLKGRNIECSLRDMLGKNDEEFAADYMGIGRMLVPPSPVPTE